MNKPSATTIRTRLRNKAVLAALLIPGTAGLLTLLAGPANAITGVNPGVVANHTEPLR